MSKVIRSARKINKKKPPALWVFFGFEIEALHIAEFDRA